MRRERDREEGVGKRELNRENEQKEKDLTRIEKMDIMR